MATHTHTHALKRIRRTCMRTSNEQCVSCCDVRVLSACNFDSPSTTSVLRVFVNAHRPQDDRQEGAHSHPHAQTYRYFSRTSLTVVCSRQPQDSLQMPLTLEPDRPIHQWYRTASPRSDACGRPCLDFLWLGMARTSAPWRSDIVHMRLGDIAIAAMYSDTLCT